MFCFSDESTFTTLLMNERKVVSKTRRLSRSSRPEVFCKKGFIKNFAKVTEKHLFRSIVLNKVAGLMILFFIEQHSEAATRGVLCKKLFLEIWQNSQESTCARVSFLIKLQTSGLQLY